MKEKKTFAELLEATQSKTRTQNGAATFNSTGDAVVNLFASGGSARKMVDEELFRLFTRAYDEDPDLTMKAIFYLRDIRGGAGERNTFRRLLRFASFYAPESVCKNIRYVPEYGRYDDLLALIGEDVPYQVEHRALLLIQNKLNEDQFVLAHGHPESISLLAKWMPSVNASSKETRRKAKYIARQLVMTDEDYRKMLTNLRKHLKLVENNLRESDYTFDYGKIPSKAFLKYNGAFHRKDEERFEKFMEAVKAGKKSVHTAVLSPTDIVASYKRKRETDDTLETLWKNLPDFMQGHNRTIVVRDGSGSMIWASVGGKNNNLSCLDVADAMTIYAAERMPGEFHNTFITFSARPELIRLKEDTTLRQKLIRIRNADDISNTNMNAVFDLILKTAVENNVPQEELPEKIVIISDMQFDQAISRADITNFEHAKARFEEAEYKLPDVVFWNVNADVFPVSAHETGTVLLSGYSPRIFEMAAGEIISPYELMKEVLCSERYAPVEA